MIIDKIKNLLGLLQSLGTSLGGVAGPLAKMPRSVLIALILLATIGICLGVWWFWKVLPAHAWAAIGLVGLVTAFIWLAVRGLPAWRRSRFLRSEGRRGPETAIGVSQPAHVLEQRIRQARNEILASSNFERGRQPLYRIPWFFIVGDETAAGGEFLKAAACSSPFPPPERGEGRIYWAWWFFKDLIAIETDAGLVCDPKDHANRQIWHDALLLLTRIRPKLPLNGIVVLVSASRLRAPLEEVREYGLKLRRLVDESMKVLALDFPVYLVVTKVDEIEGAAEFIAALPENVRSQVMGHRFEPDSARGEAPEELTRRLFEELRLRLHAIRLSALPAAREVMRRGIFAFVEEMGRLEPGLTLLAKQLFEENPLQRRPLWRGAYFTFGGQEAAFVADLFTRFLPADQPLARRTGSARTKMIARAVVALGLLVAVVFTAVSIVTSSYGELEPFVAEAKRNCSALTGREEIPLQLRNLRACRTSVEEIEETLEGRIPLLRPEGAKTAEWESKQRYIGTFREVVLAPIDQALNDGRTLTFGHSLAAAQRVRILGGCQAKKGGCAAVKGKPNLLFTTETVPSLLTPPADPAGATRRADEGLADELLAGYFAYVRWLDASAFATESEVQKNVFKSLLRRALHSTDNIAAWAAARYEPYRASDLWQPKAINRVDTAAEAETMLGAAFTGSFRRRLLLPFAATVQALAPDQEEALWSSYRVALFAEWERFLSGFPQSRLAWRGNARGLINLMAQPGEGPYERLWGIIRRDLLSDDIPAQIRPTWLMALASDIDQVWPAIDNELGQLLFDLRSDESGSVALKMAAELFSEWHQPKAPFAQRFQRLWQEARYPPADLQKIMTAADYQAWRVFQEPVRLFFEILVARAGDFLDFRWEQDVLFPLSELPKDEVLREMLEENGKLAVFVSGQLEAFLDKNWAQNVQVLDCTFPFSDQFRLFLLKIQDLKRKSAGKGSVRGILRFTRPTEFGAGFHDGPQGTRVVLDCLTRPFAASSRPQVGIANQSLFLWSEKDCPEVRIDIDLPKEPLAEDEGISPPLGTIRYSGSKGFRDFVRTFKNGAYSFGLGELFRGQPFGGDMLSQLKSKGISGAKVFLQVTLDNDSVLQTPEVPALPSRLTERPEARRQL